MRRAVLLLLLAALAGCASAPVESPLLVVGPESLQPVLRALIEAAGEPGRIVDGQGASTAAILAARRGSVDLAFTSRDLQAHEDTELMRAHLLAREGLAFAVHPSNPLQAVGFSRLEELLEGQMGDWSELGGPPGPIRVLVPRGRVSQFLGDPTSEGFEVLEPPAAVAALKADPRALGLFPSGSLPPGLRLLQPDEVPLEERTLLSGRYPASRSYFVVLRRDAAPRALGFLDFCLGPEGQGVLQHHGLVRVR